MRKIGHFDVKVGESLAIGNDVIVTLQKKSGQLARLTVDRPDSMRVEVKRNGAASHAARGITLKAA